VIQSALLAAPAVVACARGIGGLVRNSMSSSGSSPPLAAAPVARMPRGSEAREAMAELRGTPCVFGVKQSMVRRAGWVEGSAGRSDEGRWRCGVVGAEVAEGKYQSGDEGLWAVSLAQKSIAAGAAAGGGRVSVLRGDPTHQRPDCQPTNHPSCRLASTTTSHQTRMSMQDSQSTRQHRQPHRCPLVMMRIPCISKAPFVSRQPRRNVATCVPQRGFTSDLQLQLR